MSKSRGSTCTVEQLVKELNFYKESQWKASTFRKTKQAGNVPFKVLKTGGDIQGQRCYQIILLDERFEENSAK